LSKKITRLFFICTFLLLILSSQIQATITSDHAMVASAHPLVSSIGIDILKQGGNAVDAAVAMALALTVAEPNASGIGGGGFMIIKMANQDEAVMIDYREIAPQNATSNLYYKSDSSFDELTRSGPLSMGVPGLPAGAELALKQFGTMTLSQILQPTIKLADEGFAITENLSWMITDKYELISQYPATSAIYLADMLPLQPGDILINKDLAQTLLKIANHGAEVFYRGEVAQAISNDVKKHGGVLQLSDLNNYQAKTRKPVTGNYRGYQIITAAPPSGGGMFLIELLNIMEGFNIREMGHNSAQFIHLFTEALKMIYADKSQNAADPDFYDVPVDSIVHKSYAAKLRKAINPQKAMFNYAPPKWIDMESNSTSHLSVIDERGNIVALTQSINYWFGSGIVVSGTGILLNNHMRDFENQKNTPNSVAPFKRPVSSVTPTIILKDGKPFMTAGTPGGSRIISAMAQIIINAIDFHMSMDEAIEAPRVHCVGKVLHLESRIDKQTIQQLESMGHKIQIHGDYDNYFGGAQGIKILLKSGNLDGGADSRRDGVAIGY